MSDVFVLPRAAWQLSQVTRRVQPCVPLNRTELVEPPAMWERARTRATEYITGVI